MADPLNGTVVRSRTAAHRVVDGQTIIVLTRSREAMVLNETGTLVWSLSDGTRDIDAVAHEIAARYDVSEEQARTDVEALYRQLIEAGAAEERG